MLVGADAEGITESDGPAVPEAAVDVPLDSGNGMDDDSGDAVGVEDSILADPVKFAVMETVELA